MNTYLLTIINSTIDGLVFFVAAFLILLSKDKLRKKDNIVLFSFWFITGLTFIIIAIQTTFFYYLADVSTSFLLVRIMANLGLISGWIGAYFFTQKIFESKRVRIVVMIIFSILLFLMSYIFTFKTQKSLWAGEPRIEVGNQVLVNYLMGALLLIFNLSVFYILWKEFRKGNISWGNLSILYRILALGVYGAVSFLRVFYFFPRPWYLRIFYLLVPYLNYLANKEEKKDNLS